MRFYIVILVAAVFCTVSASEQQSRDGLETELEKERTRRILLEDNYYTIVSRLDSLTTKVTDLDNKYSTGVANLNSKYKTDVAYLDNKYSTDVANLKQTVATLFHDTVAFKAHMTKSLVPTPNQLIEFDDVQFNLGHAYHAGTFIAPYNGTYLFSVAICSHGGHYVSVNLMRNGAMIGQVLAGDETYDSCNSETTITELNAADDVNVHFANNGDSVLGGKVNSFTGVLLSVRP